MPNPQPTRPRGRPKGTGKPIKDPEAKAVRVNISMSPELAEELKRLGGAKWVQMKIKEARL